VNAAAATLPTLPALPSPRAEQRKDGEHGAEQESEHREGCPATRHDTAVAYRHSGCRCPQARVEWRRYNLGREAGIHVAAMVDATGSRRRIHALQAAGYPLATIAAALGYHSGRQALGPLLSPRRRTIRRARAEQITALYQQWSRLPGPSPLARQRAQTAGHPAPAQWRGRDIDDPTARPHGASTLLAPAARSDVDDAWAGAVCRSGVADPDLWHRNQQQAVRLCAGCPLRRPCLRDALVRNETEGAWGGLTRPQRQELRRSLLAQLGPDEPLEGSAVLDEAVDALGAKRRGERVGGRG
jgi:hypothetical protein